MVHEPPQRFRGGSHPSSNSCWCGLGSGDPLSLPPPSRPEPRQQAPRLPRGFRLPQLLSCLQCLNTGRTGSFQFGLGPVAPRLRLLCLRLGLHRVRLENLDLVP
jgi:hypothetical protein